MLEKISLVPACVFDVIFKNGVFLLFILIFGIIFYFWKACEYINMYYWCVVIQSSSMRDFFYTQMFIISVFLTIIVLIGDESETNSILLCFYLINGHKYMK